MSESAITAKPATLATLKPSRDRWIPGFRPKARQDKALEADRDPVRRDRALERPDRRGDRRAEARSRLARMRGPRLSLGELLAARRAGADIPGAMTIDVEDYYHVSAFEDVIEPADWPTWPARVAANTHRLLDLFAEAGVKATFFTLGVVARDEPALIRRMVAEGHELASHGWAHARVNTLTRAAFVEDLRRAKGVLEDLGGVAIRGYRAPSFSIDRTTPWAHAALAETGHAYSSSAHPIAHDHYGDAAGERAPHRDPESGVVEIPVTVVKVHGRRVTAGGGGFFRALPLLWFRLAARRAWAEGLPPNFYLHPWELDPGQPVVHAAPLKSRLRHRLNLRTTAAKLQKHLRSLNWDRMDRVYARWIDAPCERPARR